LTLGGKTTESTRRLEAYTRIIRPVTAFSTVLAAIGGLFYAGNPLEYSGIHIPLLVVIGVALAHFSVNALNDYLDYKSGLDLLTPRTPFSGGSKVLVDGILSPIEALGVAIALLLLALAIGLHLTLYRGLLVLVLAVTGALIIATYNKFLVKIGLGEVAVWAKGVLVFVGAHYTVAGFMTLEAVAVGMVYGGVSALILYANFIPDVEADRVVGRKTLPVLLGGRAWLGYLMISLTVTLILILLVTLKLLNPLAFLAVIPLALTYKVALKLKTSKDLKDVVEALALNARICRGVDVIATVAIVVGALL
jgi:1,4-dihydroxy-2-naphthoate octaprenyltransferase